MLSQKHPISSARERLWPSRKMQGKSLDKFFENKFWICRIFWKFPQLSYPHIHRLWIKLSTYPHYPQASLYTELSTDLSTGSDFVNFLTQSGLCLLFNKLSKAISIKLLASQDFFSCISYGLVILYFLFMSMNTSDCKGLRSLAWLDTLLAKSYTMQENK